MPLFVNFFQPVIMREKMNNHKEFVIKKSQKFIIN